MANALTAILILGTGAALTLLVTYPTRARRKRRVWKRVQRLIAEQTRTQHRWRSGL